MSVASTTLKREAVLAAVIEEHAADGVDFVTAHAGLTMKAIERLKSEGRILDVVSRGGSFLVEWIIYNEKENPLYDSMTDSAILHTSMR